MLKNLDPITQEIINIYNRIELDLLIEIAKRFDVYDEIGGSLEWQIKKLEELGSLNSDTAQVIANHSTQTNKAIEEMLHKAGYANIELDTLKQAFNSGLIGVDPIALMASPTIRATIDLSYKSLGKTLRLINTKALESAKQAYMDVLNQSYIEVASGIYDYNKAIARALQRMAAKGITGATYSRGGTTVQYSIEGTVRRDTLTAVHQLANKVSYQTVEELKAEYVEISSHLGARISLTNPIANHAGWQGKVFKIHGFDEKYGNLKNNTGYPDDIQGLGGVNCRHRLFPFFPDISKPNPIQYDEKENAERYKLEQGQRAKERKIRQTQKQIAVAEAAGDDLTAHALKRKLKQQRLDIIDYCNQHNLQRDFNREMIYTEKGE